MVDRCQGGVPPSERITTEQILEAGKGLIKEGS